MGTPFCVEAKLSEAIQLSLFTDVVRRELRCRDSTEEIKQEIKLSFICKFRLRYITGAVQAGLWLAVLESGPFHCMLCWLCLCHEMFFTAGQVWSLWCPQPEHLSLIRQAFQSCCHGYLERGRLRTKAHYWQLVHLFSLWGFLTTSLPS